MVDEAGGFRAADWLYMDWFGFRRNCRPIYCDAPPCAYYISYSSPNWVLLFWCWAKGAQRCRALPGWFIVFQPSEGL